MKVKIPYGFSSFQIGTIDVFTGKIRIKCQREVLESKLQHCNGHLQFSEVWKNFKYYTTIHFQTSYPSVNQDLIREIRGVMCELAHQRIDEKYGVMNNAITTEIEDLPY